MSAPSTAIVYRGDATIIAGGSGGDNNAVNGFIDQYKPAPSKNEWGMDTLSRLWRGTQPNYPAFVATLAQGAIHVFNGHNYFLQTFDPDNNQVFPGVQCHYKGLTGGIPDPKVSGCTIELSLTLTVNSPQEASREIRYFTRQSTYLYITSSRPTGPTYTAPDVDVEPYIFQSVIRTGDGGLFYGNAPADLVTALTPVGHVDLAVMHCSPVIGSPYFECEDVVTRFLPGGS